MKFSIRKVCCLLSAVALLAYTPLSASANYYTADYEREAQQIMYLVNLQRIANGVPPLMTNYGLLSCAKLRAQEIPVRFSHTRIDGTSCFTVFRMINTEYSAAAENLAASSENTPEKIVQIWLESKAGHRETMLDPTYTHAGVGVVEIDGVVYASQLFMLPKSEMEESYFPEDTTPKVTGDINNDDIVNVGDAVEILMDSAQAGTTGETSFSEEQVKNCDFNMDGVCNSEDASYILQYASYIGAGGELSIVDWYLSIA